MACATYLAADRFDSDISKTLRPKEIAVRVCNNLRAVRLARVNKVAACALEQIGLEEGIAV